MKKKSNSAFAHITMGIELAVIMLVFVYGGYKLDVTFDKMPLFICLGAAVGMGAGLYNMMRGLKALEKTMKENKEENEGEKSVKWM